jgi:hypothetical protein
VLSHVEVERCGLFFVQLFYLHSLSLLVQSVTLFFFFPMMREGRKGISILFLLFLIPQTPFHLLNFHSSTPILLSSIVSLLEYFIIKLFFSSLLSFSICISQFNKYVKEKETLYYSPHLLASNTSTPLILVTKRKRKKKPSDAPQYSEHPGENDTKIP